MNAVYEVFACRGGTWVMLGSTSSRQDAESMFTDAAKDKAVQGVRLVEERMDPNTGDMRDRVIQRRDKEENLPYFSARQAMRAAPPKPAARPAPPPETARGKPAADAGATSAAGADAATGDAGKPPAARAARRGDSGFLTRHLPLTLAATALPIGLVIAHERLLRLVPTEAALGAGVVLFLALQWWLNRDILNGTFWNRLFEDAPEAAVPGQAARPTAGPKRRRMQMIGILGQKKPEDAAEATEAATDDGTSARAEAVAADTKQLLGLMQDSLQSVAAGSQRFAGGRLSHLDLFACHLFFAAAVRAFCDSLERRSAEVQAVLRGVLRVLSPDERLLDWFIDSEDRHLSDPRAQAVAAQGHEAGAGFAKGDTGMVGRLLQALDLWNGPKAGAPLPLVLLHVGLPGEAGSLTPGVRACIARCGGREQGQEAGRVLACFVSPLDAVAAAAEIQVTLETMADIAAGAGIALHAGPGLDPGTPDYTRAAGVVAALAHKMGGRSVALTAPVARAVESVYGLVPRGEMDVSGTRVATWTLGDAGPVGASSAAFPDNDDGLVPA